MPSGVNPSIFLPTLANVRLANDISKSLRGGPTAWDARLELGILTASSHGVDLLIDAHTALSLIRIVACVSSSPRGETPLNWFLARPSQKLSKLKTALIMVGVLR